MRLYRSPAAIARHRSGEGCVATVGAYDGLHLGHQAILEQLKAESARLGCPSLVFSFEPAPKEYFSPEHPPARLMRFYEKFRALDALGIDEFYCGRFNDAMRNMPPEQFIEQLLIEGLAAKHLVVGHDFRFAARREGTIEHLKAAGERYGFGVTEVPAVYHGEERVSSSAVRHALASGDLAKARSMLGRDYMMSGRIVEGAKLGRKLGFPTANVPVKRRLSAVMGIFAVQVRGLREGLLDGVASVGTRPTVNGGGETLLEVFIFDFDRDIYGRYIDVDFVSRLRDELKFPDLESMKVRMHQDVAEARAVLAERRSLTTAGC